MFIRTAFLVEMGSSESSLDEIKTANGATYNYHGDDITVSNPDSKRRSVAHDNAAMDVEIA